MRRYLANGKCVFCHSEKNVEDVLLTVNKKSIVVSICSPRCLSMLLESLTKERTRRRFLKSASSPNRY